MKTISLKKVSAVAVASLGFGLLSVVPAQSAITAGTGTLTVAAATVDDEFATTSSTAAGSFTMGFTAGATSDAVVVTATIATSVSGATATVAVGTGGTAVGSATLANSGATATVTAASATASGGTFPVTATVSKPGVYVVTLTPNAAGTAAGMPIRTITMTLSALFAKTGDGLANGTASKSTVTGVAGSANSVTLGAVQQGTTARLITISGAGATIASGGTVATGGLSSVQAAGSAATITDIVVNTPSVGVATVNIFEQSAPGIYSATPLSTVTITVNATANVGTYSSTFTKVFLSDTVGTAETVADDTVTKSMAVSATSVAQIDVTLKDAQDLALASKTVTAIISGAGLISAANDGTAKANVAVLTTGAGGDDILYVYGSGVAGKGIITISYGTTVLATKTVTFYGDATKIVATQVLKRASSSGAVLGDTSSATTAAVTLLVTDAANNPVPSITPTITSATPTVISTGTCSASSATGVSFCSVTSAAETAGKTASVTFKTTVNTVDVVSNAVVFTLGGALAKYSIAFDKTSYTAGSLMKLVITGVDSKNLPTFDGSKDILDGNASGNGAGVVTSASVTNDWTAAVAGLTFVDGKAELSIYAPLSAGPFSVVLDVASGFETAIGSTTLTASTTVTDASAAIQTSIAALNAKIVALNALIAKIMKRLNIR